MTVQEKALKWIQKKMTSIKDSLTNDKDQLPKQNIKMLNEAASALTTAKIAVQRQTAVTAICPEKMHDVLACPRCGHYLDGKPFFCHYCGQHIKYAKVDLTEYTTFDEVIPVTVTRNTTKGKDIITIETSNGTTISLDLKKALNVSNSTPCECTVSYRDYR